jgi:exopolysaccharide biosynthesis polyprenyl glycosylphosphotransferase
VDPRRPVVSRPLLLAGDAAIFLASLAAALELQGRLRELTPLLRAPSSGLLSLAALLFPVWILLLLALPAERSPRALMSPAWAATRLLRLHATAVGAFALLLFLSQAVVNRSVVGLLLFFTFTLMLLERLLLARWLRHQHATGQERVRFLLVGADPRALSEFAREARHDPLPADLVGRLGPAAGVEAPAPDLPPRLGEITDLERVLHSEAVDRVVFFAPYDRPDAAREALAVLEMFGVSAHFAVPRVDPVLAVPRVSVLYGAPFVSYEIAPKEPEDLALKHAIDLLLALAGMLLLLPLLLVTALTILLVMGRPVLFAQERVGLHGRRFRMLKFRTMVRGAEEQRDALLDRNETRGPAFKMRDDPRVTRLGRFLRKWSLDELPQLVNVLLGSMSLVGPRPLPPQEQADVRGGNRRRLSMKPGITGLWQVSGRNELGFDEWMRLDLRYVDEWTLGLDFRILLRTLPAVLLARGAR